MDMRLCVNKEVNAVDELLRVESGDYEEYEHLLLERDQYEKEAQIYRQLYIHEFGELISTVFEQKIACIRRKKEISFCQMQLNSGQVINLDEMNELLNREMAAYQEELNRMIEENEACKDLKTSSMHVVMKVKRIYHRLVKLIHPDMNPLTEYTPGLMELWQRIVIAYHGNALKEIQELEVLVHAYLAENGQDEMEILIPDLEERIQEVRSEISEILNTEPYLYKEFLEQPKLDEKRTTLQAELEQYTDYLSELNEVFDLLIQNGGMKWRMN